MAPSDAMPTAGRQARSGAAKSGAGAPWWWWWCVAIPSSLHLCADGNSAALCLCGGACLGRLGSHCFGDIGIDLTAKYLPKSQHVSQPPARAAGTTKDRCWSASGGNLRMPPAQRHAARSSACGCIDERNSCEFGRQLGRAFLTLGFFNHSRPHASGCVPNRQRQNSKVNRMGPDCVFPRIRWVLAKRYAAMRSQMRLCAKAER